MKAVAPIILLGLLASVVVSLAFAIWWVCAAIPYYTDGPRDLPGFIGWRNIATDVGVKSLVVGFMHTLPPWVLFAFVMALVRLNTVRHPSLDPVRHTPFGQIAAMTYLFCAGLFILGWFFYTGSNIWHAVVVVAPGLLVWGWLKLSRLVFA